MTTKDLQLLAFEIAKEFTPKCVYDYFNGLLGEVNMGSDEVYNIEDPIWPDCFPETDDWCLNIEIEGDFDCEVYGERDYEEYVFDDFTGIKDIRVYEVCWEDFDGAHHSLNKEEMAELAKLLKEIY